MTSDQRATTVDDVEQLDVAGFTAHELAYLLSLNPSAAAERVVAALHLGDGWNAPETIALGASSLLAHGGLVSDDGTDLVPVARARDIGALLTLSDRETEFAVVTDQLTEAAILFESTGGQLLCQPRALGTWWFTPISEAAARGDVLGAVLLELASVVPGTIALTIRSETESSSNTLTARRVGAPEWQIAYGTTGLEEPDIQLSEDDDRSAVAVIVAWANALSD